MPKYGYHRLVQSHWRPSSHLLHEFLASYKSGTPRLRSYSSDHQKNYFSYKILMNSEPSRLPGYCSPMKLEKVFLCWLLGFVFVGGGFFLVGCFWYKLLLASIIYYQVFPYYTEKSVSPQLAHASSLRSCEKVPKSVSVYSFNTVYVSCFKALVSII